MIDCDRVFDVLTRGPFPSGAADDAAVEAHLVECHECARLAAALRPAIELFEEAIGPDEAHDLPGYWGEVEVESSERRAARADTAHQIRRRVRKPLVHYSHAVGQLTSSNVWQVAALVALGVFIGSVLRGFTPGQSDRPRDGAANVAAATGPAQSGRVAAPATPVAPAAAGDTVVSLTLACLGAGVKQNLNEVPDHPKLIDRRFVDLDHCCTECHNGAPDTVIPQSATASVQLSCRFCHVN